MANFNAMTSNNWIAKHASAFITNNFTQMEHTGPRSAVDNVSGNRCESDCRSRGHEFDPGPVPNSCGD